MKKKIKNQNKLSLLLIAMVFCCMALFLTSHAAAEVVSNNSLQNNNAQVEQNQVKEADGEGSSLSDVSDTDGTSSQNTEGDTNDVIDNDKNSSSDDKNAGQADDNTANLGNSATALTSNDATPLTFTAQENDSSVTFDYKSGSNVQYKLNSGDWTDYTKNTTVSLANVGYSVSFKGENVITQTTSHFTMSGKIAASGDITSLTNGSGGEATLTESCYLYMFVKCSALTTAPNLPATTLADRCYAGMFSGCTSLTTAPNLPATTLANYCYNAMFFKCTNLASAPNLPATTLAESCYKNMFTGCTGITLYENGSGDSWSIPQGATTATDWNKDMFKDTGGSFTGAPEVGKKYYYSGTITVTENPSTGLTYDKSSHKLGTITTTPNDCKKEYRLSEQENWSETEPVATDAGPYTVYYKASKTGYTDATGSFQVTVAKATPIIDPFTCSDIKYGETPSPSATTTFGTPTFSYSNSESGTFGEWSTTNLPGIYYVKASVAEDDNWNAADKTISFTLKTISESISIDAIADQTYAGKEIKPALTVKDKEGNTLTADDYNATYEDNINAGTAKVIITGKQGYTGLSATTSFAINKRPITLTSKSATKVYDGSALTEEEVEVTSGSFAEGETVTYGNFMQQTEVGVCQNSFDILWAGASAKEGNYDVTKEYGTLEVTSNPGSDIKIDTNALKDIKAEYEKANPGSKVTVEMNVVDNNVPEEDIAKIKIVAGDKKLTSVNANLIVKVDDKVQTDAGDKNEIPVGITYNFDYANRSDFQVFRVHNVSVNEITQTKVDDESVAYDKESGTVIVTAKKYSTYSIAYTEDSSPTPVSESVSSGSTKTGDMVGALGLGLLGVVITTFGACVLMRRRELNK